MSDDSSARSPALNAAGHPDDVIMHEVQPLVNAQATYIEQLEFEMGQKAYSLTNLETTIGQMGDKHEKDLEEMSAKFKKLDAAYRSDAIETHKQLNLISLERSENERLL